MKDKNIGNISHMNINILQAYQKLPKYVQAIIAALLSFFLNISVAIVLVLLVSNYIKNMELSNEPTTANVLGIATKKGYVVFDIVKNIFYVAEGIVNSHLK